MGEQSQALPMPRGEVMPLVEDQLDRFAGVLREAWSALDVVRGSAPAQMTEVGAGSRAMLVSDFSREPAHRIFASVPGVSVDDRYRQPWVNLAGGRVQVRFRKLTSELQICASESVRATRLAYHLGDPLLPEMPHATVLTAGYVLDTSELTIAQLALVCHIGDHVHYVVDLPGGAETLPAPVQLPLVPLSAPVIRSARDAVARRLERPAGTDG